MRKILIAVAAAAIGICALAPLSVSADVRPLVIEDDEGGDLGNFLVWYGRVRDSGVPVRIRGLCQSACTLFFGVVPPAQICIEPTASLGFHLFAETGQPNLGLTQAYMRRYYPASLQEALGKIKLTAMMVFMSADEIVKIGAVRACDVVVVEPPK